jgi:hypothetical protein
VILKACELLWSAQLRPGSLRVHRRLPFARPEPGSPVSPGTDALFA